MEEKLRFTGPERYLQHIELSEESTVRRFARAHRCSELGGLDFSIPEDHACFIMKTVGRRRPEIRSPAESLRVAEQMIREAERLAGRARRKAFVLKMPSYDAYEEWKRAQRDPRYS